MSDEQQSQQPSQDLNISDSVLKDVQIGGIAGRDLNLTQIQGGVGAINVFGKVQVDRVPTSTAKSISQQEYRWRRVLLDKVKSFWIDGVLAKSLHTQVLIELGLEERSEFVQSPLSEVEEFPSTSGEIFPVGTTAANIFEDIGAGRTLLILGEPGAGKTVTLLKLAESLIARTENDLSQPLPVVVNLSSWAKQRKSIADWLVQELYKIYGASKSLGKAWVEQEQLILLLDGLDEVNAEYRNDCVKALNQFIQDHGLTEIVVCSRIRDYERLSERLKLHSAICVQSLTSQQIDQFLERAGESLCDLKEVLQHNTELRAFASSPLILSIMSLAYQGLPKEKIVKSKTILGYQRDLFNTYMNRMFEGARKVSYTQRNKEKTQKYPKKKAQNWLIWIAKKMVQTSQTVFLIESIQPDWISTDHPVEVQNSLKEFASCLMKFIFHIIKSVILFFILLFIGVLIVGTPFLFFADFLIETYLGKCLYFLYLYPTLSLLITLIHISFLSQDDKTIKPVELLSWRIVDLRNWKTSKIWISIYPFIYLTAVSLIVFFITYFIGLGIWFKRPFEILFEKLKSVTSELIYSQHLQKYSYPNQGVFETVKNIFLFIIFGFTNIILISLLILIVYHLESYWRLVLILLILPIFLAFFCVLLAGTVASMAALGKHILLRLTLWRKNYAPWNYAQFLDYATERLFLQKVGGGYIFVHRMLLEHFAKMELEQGKR